MSQSTTTKPTRVKDAPPREASEPMTQRLIELSARTWTADASGALQSVSFGNSHHGATSRSVQCNTGLSISHHALDGNAQAAARLTCPTSAHTSSAESVIVDGLRKIAKYLETAVNAGTQSLHVFVDCAALLGHALLETRGACGQAAAYVRQLLTQIPGVSLQGARMPSTTLVRQLKKNNASSWQVNAVGILRWVQFGDTSTRNALAFSDAGIRNECCTIGGVIREGKEVVGMVMERTPDTKNVVLAELLGVSRILEEALALGIEALEVRIDCLAVVEHVVRVREGECGVAGARIRHLISQFKSVKLAAVSRNLNKEADALATSARECYETVDAQPLEAPTPVVAAKTWSMNTVRKLLANITWPVVGQMA